MVGRTPQWEAFRIRSPIPKRLPGYLLTSYSPRTFVYQFSAAGTVYCIDLDSNQIVSEGLASVVGTGGFQAGGADISILPSCCPPDGTISTAWTALQIGAPIPSAYGMLGRQADTLMRFPIASSNAGTAETICDCSNGPAEWCCFTTTSTSNLTITHWYFGRKNDLNTATFASNQAGIANPSGVDCDRAGNWYIFSQLGVPGSAGTTLCRMNTSGSVFSWKINPDHTGATTPKYAGGRVGTDKLVCVGPPEQNGAVWNQNVFVAMSSGWLSKHDCRTGAWVIGGNTTLRPSQLSAAPDGLVLTNSGVITKVNLDTLATIWTHNPNSFAVQGLTPGRIAVDGCGDVIYTTGADTQGAVHIRKIKSADGTPLIDRKFFLPIAGAPIVCDSGRVGGYSFCSEPWVAAGKPPISFS